MNSQHTRASRSRLGQLVGGALAAMSLSCETTLDIPPRHPDISLHAGTGYWSARVTPRGLHGPVTSAEFYGNELRGDINRLPVSVMVDDDQMTAQGLLAGQPVHIHVTPELERLHVNGMFGGSFSEYDIGARWIAGRVGSCGYQLVATGEAVRDGVRFDDFEGMRGCGAGVVPTELEIPDSLARFSPTRFAVLLSLLLGTR